MTGSTRKIEGHAGDARPHQREILSELFRCQQSTSLPPLILIPGVSGARELFDSIHGRLSRERHVLVVDLRDRNDRALLSPSGAGRALMNTVSKLGWDQVDVLGQSFGSVVAVRMWKESPQTVRKLILAPPAILPRKLSAYTAMLRWASMGLMVRLWPRSNEAELERRIKKLGGYALEPDLSGDQFRAFVKRVQKARVASLFGRLLALMGHSWIRELAGVRAPLLILEGDRELDLVPDKLLRYFRALPTARLAVVPGGHMPFLTHPDEFCRAVLDFLDGKPSIESRTA